MATFSQIEPRNRHGPDVFTPSSVSNKRARKTPRMISVTAISVAGASAVRSAVSITAIMR